MPKYKPAVRHYIRLFCRAASGVRGTFARLLLPRRRICRLAVIHSRSGASSPKQTPVNVAGRRLQRQRPRQRSRRAWSQRDAYAIPNRRMCVLTAFTTTDGAASDRTLQRARCAASRRHAERLSQGRRRFFRNQPALRAALNPCAAHIPPTESSYCRDEKSPVQEPQNRLSRIRRARR